MNDGMKHGMPPGENRGNNPYARAARRGLERAAETTHGDRVGVSGVALVEAGPSSRSRAISHAVEKYLSGDGWLVPKRGFVQAFPEWVSFVEDFLGTVET